MAGCADAGSPASLSGLLNAIAEDYELTFYFGFGANADQGEGEADAAPFGDLALSEKVVKARKSNDDAKNLLNFSFDGSAELTSGKTVVGKYTIDVDIDLDIFPLIPALLECVTLNEAGNMPAGFEVKDIDKLVAAIKEMGYISIIVDEVYTEGEEAGKFKKNVITIYSDFSEGEAIIQINGEAVPVVGSVTIGGYYDFNALAHAIGDMITGAMTQEEGGLDIAAILGEVIGLTNIDTNDIAGSLKDGFKLDMTGIVPLISKLGVDVSSFSSFVADIWKGADTLTIKVNTPAEEIYGYCDDETTITEISAVENNSTPSTLVNEITDIQGLPTLITAGDNSFIGMGKTYQMKGTPIGGGEEVSFTGYIVGYDRLDATKSGKQTITLYVAAAHADTALDSSIIKGFIDLTSYPLFGLYEKEWTVDVIVAGSEGTTETVKAQPADGEAIEINTEFDANGGSITTPTAIYGTLAKDASNSIVITVKGGELEKAYTFKKADMVVLDSKGVNVTADVYNASADAITKAGEYTLAFVVGDVNVKVAKVSVTSYEALRADDAAMQTEVSMNGGTIYSKFDAILKTTPDGKTTELAATEVKLAGTDLTGKIDGTYTFISSDLSLLNKTVYFTVSALDGENTVSVNTPAITIISDYLLEYAGSMANNGVGVGQSINGLFTLTVKKDGVTTVYSIKYDAESKKLIFVDENGNVFGEEFTLTWNWTKGDKEAITFDENGVANNMPVDLLILAYENVKMNFAIGDKYGASLTVRFNLTNISNTVNFDEDDVQLNTLFTEEDIFGNTTVNADGMYAYDEDGNRIDLEFKYGKEGYGYYAVGTDKAYYKITILVGSSKGGNELASKLVDGKLVAYGTYYFTVEVTLPDGKVFKKACNSDREILPAVGVSSDFTPALNMTLDNMLTGLDSLGTGLVFKYDASSINETNTDGYAIFNAEGELVYDVVVKVKYQDGWVIQDKIAKWADYTMSDGKLAAANTYKVTYEIHHTDATFTVEQEFTIA